MSAVDVRSWRLRGVATARGSVPAPGEAAPGHPEIDHKQDRSRDGPAHGSTVAVALDAYRQQHDADHWAHQVHDGVQATCDLRKVGHGLIVTANAVPAKQQGQNRTELPLSVWVEADPGSQPSAWEAASVCGWSWR